MDFCKIKLKEAKGRPQAYPDWIMENFEDLMVRGGAFYAVWDEEEGMWSTDEFDVCRMVDRQLYKYVSDAEAKGDMIDPMLMRNFGTGSWETFNRYIRNLPKNSYHQLDECLTFANSEVTKKDYVSRRLPYGLVEGRTDAWDELLGVLYAPEERDKIEWTIGAIVSGDSKWIQKFLVFYGPPGTGKSTVIDVIEKLFEGYTATFEAKALTSRNATFAMESFESNPLVAIQHDGDLSRVEDNTRLNSIVGHDSMTMNVKYRSSYTIRPNAFLIVGTNKPVKITDAKAGNTRRLIDVHPTGVKIEPGRYHILCENVNYELGAIAHKCLQRYREMGKFYYEGYIPTRMMMLTDTFYNFVEAHYDIFKSHEGIQLKYAWDLYKQYCDDTNIRFRLQYHEARDELTNYFEELKDRHVMGDKEYRSVYVGFKGLPEHHTHFVPDTSYVIELGDFDAELHPSAFNELYSGQLAQEANGRGVPARKWDRVTTTLDEIDTRKLHYVQVPEAHVVIDFDLVDEDGEKDLEQNIARASQLPPTYTELSQSGKALHLHYIYSGDVTNLSSVFDVGIEIKTLLGHSSLRRRLTKCNNLEIATLTGGLPTKEKKMLETKNIQSERGLRDLIDRNLRKEIHPGTKPSVDFIHHLLEEAYEDGLSYDLTDMRPVILAFAAKSSHQAPACISLVQTMKFQSKNRMPEVDDGSFEKPLTFFDVEVYPNLFVVCWKHRGMATVARMINPTADEIAPLFNFRLVGFNNRRYDNHILYARYMGYSLEELYDISQKIIYSGPGDSWGLFGEAYNISYADIFDFSSEKKGLKKFQIELGIHHMELDIPWDQPVPEGQWSKVEEYCVNDVIATEAVFESRIQDFVARQILAELSGLSVNHTTQQHTAKILFGDDMNPQRKFVYTDLSEMFPGYVFDGKSSTYGGETTGEGGYVYSEPGYYENVALLDVASMHPTSIELLNLFGPYTGRFSELKEARMAIKHQDYERARGLLGGKLAQFLEHAEDDPAGGAELSYALKIVINIVYGLTSARFPNPFKDPRNRDNIVAKRGALFMIDLKNAVQEQAEVVIHIKTDSIKIPNATPEIIQFVIDFGRKYGYEFEHETTYEKLLLVNDAVYVARAGGKWTAVGAQFQHPYVFKELFSHEPLEFDDLCEVKNVTQGTMYLGGFDDSVELSDLRHVGRTGSFMPVRYEGASLWRVKDDKRYAVAGTKGYQWIERETAKYRDSVDELFTDMDYFEKLKSDALKAIEKYVPYEELVS